MTGSDISPQAPGREEAEDALASSRAAAVSRWLGLAAAAIGALALIGWAFDVALLKSVLPGLPAMKVNSAIGLILLGVALSLASDARAATARLSVGLAPLAAAIGAATIVQYATGRDLGIDQLLFREEHNAVGTVTPGRMTLATAICFVLLGVALPLIRSNRRVAAAQALASAAGLAAVLEFVAVVYGARSGTPDAPFQLMAIRTSLALTLITCGALLARADLGFMAVATAAGPGGRFLRRVVPLASLTGVVIFGAANLAHGAGFVGEQIAFAMGIVTLFAVLTIVAWMVADPLDRGDLELRGERAQLQSVLDSASDGILTVDASGRIRMSNPMAERIFGYPTGELEGLALEDLVPERSRHDHPAHRADFEAGVHGLTTRTQIVGLRRDGSEFHGELSLARLELPGETQTTAIVRDVTESKEAERALRESEERFRTLTDQIPSVVIMEEQDDAGIDGFRVAFVGPQVFDLLGYSPEEFVADQMLWASVAVPEDRPMLDEVNERSLATGQPYRVEYRALTRAGDIKWVHEESVRTGEEGSYVWHGLMTDISDRKRAEAELREKEAAVRANEMKGEFLSRMSHELRTPLNAILGFAQLLEMDELDEGSRESADHILRSGRHLLALVDEILDISSVGDRGMILEPVALAQVAREAIDEIHPAAAEHGILVVLSGETDLQAMADPAALARALRDLLSNAVKFNHEGGEVEVSFVELPDERVRIDVRDTGKGIPAEKMARLFSPFDRLDAEKTEVEGIGLGLVLCRALVESMGGTVSVESSEDTGSTFSIELNRSADR